MSHGSSSGPPDTEMRRIKLVTPETSPPPTVEAPKGKSSLQLKKDDESPATTPTRPPASGGLKPPGPLTLKKPTAVTLTPPGQGGGDQKLQPPPQAPAQPPSTLSAPEPLADSGKATKLSLKRPETAAPPATIISHAATPGTVALKKPTNLDMDAAPPAKADLSPPGQGIAAEMKRTIAVAKKPSPESDAATQLHRPSEAATTQETASLDESSLSLKPPSGISDDDTGAELALRRTTDSVDQPSPSANVGGLTLRKPKGATEEEKPKGGGLTLRKDTAGGTANDMPIGYTTVLPPGLEIPEGAELQPPPAVSEPAEPPAGEATDSTDLDADAEAPPVGAEPVAQIAFARKNKSGLSRQLKVNIAIFTIPTVLICLAGAVFLKNLIGAKKPTEKNSLQQQEEELLRKKQAKAAEEQSATQAEPTVVESQEEVVETAVVEATEPDIEFPQELADKILAEFGREVRDATLKEWATKTNAARRAFLVDIGYWAPGKSNAPPDQQLPP